MVYRVPPGCPMGVAHLNIVFALKDQAMQWIVTLMELFSVLKRMIVYYQMNVNLKKDAVLVKYLPL